MNKKFYPSNIWQVLLAFIVPMLIISPILFLTNGKIEQDLESLIIFVLIGIGFSLFTYLINRKRNIPMRYSFKWPKTQWLLLLIGIVILYQLGINNPLFKLILNLLDKPTTTDYKGIYIIGAILIGPVVEEVIFRGIILKGLLLNYKPWIAIVLSTLLFSLAHAQPDQLIGAFIIGLFFAWVFYKTENLLLVIILHSVANATSFLSNHLPSSPYFIPITILILLFLYWKYLPKKDINYLTRKNSNT